MTLYVVTGGAGFIGSHLTTALVARGDRVRVLDNLSSGRTVNLEGLEVGALGSGAPVELVEGDIRDGKVVRQACRGAEGIFHKAAMVSVPLSVDDPLGCYDVNVRGLMEVLEAARAEGVGRLVFAASSAAYGDTETLPKVETMAPRPLSPYASSKLAGEHLLAVYGRTYGMHTVSLRYFNVFGPRQVDDSPYTGVIAIFARALLEDLDVKIYGDGEQTRDFVFVDNAVRANLLAMDANEGIEPGEVMNVGTGDRITINALYHHMARLADSRREPTYLPDRAGDVRDSQASFEKARRLLGYEPVVGWRDGLDRTLAWYRESLRGSAGPR